VKLRLLHGDNMAIVDFQEYYFDKFSDDLQVAAIFEI